MEHDIRAVATEQPPDMLLVHLSVVLIVGGTTDPSVINPDFLRHKAIVERGLEVEEPPISTPLFSQVAFKDGIAVIAEPNRFVIREQGDSLTEENCKSPEIVRRFLDEFSHLSYSAIGINLQGFRPSDDESAGSVVDALVDGGKWMLFRDVLPHITLKAFYRYENRRITMEVTSGRRQVDNNSDGSPGLLFQANIHRDIAETNQEQRLKKLSAILSAWRDDISDFKNLTAKFNPERSV